MINLWQTITRGGCVRKAWKPPSSRPILIYFEFRSKPSLVTVISWTLTRPTNFNLLRQNIVFSYSERIPVPFSWLFHYFSFFFCYFTLLLIFTKIMSLLLLFYYIYIFFFFFFFFYFFMFRDVPCSWFYRRPFYRYKDQRRQFYEKTLFHFLTVIVPSSS